VTVLGKIIDLTRVDDWKLGHVENFFSTPTPVTKLEFLTNLERHTVVRALKTLVRDGVINANPREKNSYSINPETIRAFASNYLTRRTRSLERKILNTVRMKFSRKKPEDQISPAWSSIHPEQCACVPHFCPHPATI
jgi:hypothetical protein